MFYRLTLWRLNVHKNTVKEGFRQLRGGQVARKLPLKLVTSKITQKLTNGNKKIVTVFKNKRTHTHSFISKGVKSTHKAYLSKSTAT